MQFGENPTPVENNEEQNLLPNHQTYNKAKQLLDNIANSQGKLSIKEEFKDGNKSGSKGETISASSRSINTLYPEGETAPKSYGDDITFKITKYNEQNGENKDTIITILGTGEIEIDGKSIPDNLKEKVLTKIESEISELQQKKKEIKEKQRLKEQQENEEKKKQEKNEAEKEINELMDF